MKSRKETIKIKPGKTKICTYMLNFGKYILTKIAIIESRHRLEAKYFYLRIHATRKSKKKRKQNYKHPIQRIKC